MADLQEAYPDVPIVTSAIDEKLSQHGFITLAPGDAFWRMFGTT